MTAHQSPRSDEDAIRMLWRRVLHEVILCAAGERWGVAHAEVISSWHWLVDETGANAHDREIVAGAAGMSPSAVRAGVLRAIPEPGRPAVPLRELARLADGTNRGERWHGRAVLDHAESLGVGGLA